LADRLSIPEEEKKMAVQESVTGCAYVWVIDVQHSPDAWEEGGAVGTSGPRSADESRVDRMRGDLRIGEMFRMRDGVGVLMFSGRIDFGSQHRRKWNWFAPLDQFGRAYGCTSVEYYENGKWVEA
jgi:hypothetical protein